MVAMALTMTVAMVYHNGCEGMSNHGGDVVQKMEVLRTALAMMVMMVL